MSLDSRIVPDSLPSEQNPPLNLKNKNTYTPLNSNHNIDTLLNCGHKIVHPLTNNQKIVNHQQKQKQSK